jgi:3-hydroxyacyl-[acyl-carrier-protein] dehydratase
MRFIMIDKIVELVPGKSMVAEKTLPSTETLFTDHFPGFPVVPGVLLTEMMAQAAGKCLDAEKSGRGNAMLGKIVSATFRKWVKPDETAVIHARIESNREEYATAKCFIKVNDVKVASSELFFTFLPLSQLAPDYHDEILEAYLSSNVTPE